MGLVKCTVRVYEEKDKRNATTNVMEQEVRNYVLEWKWKIGIK